MDQEARDLLIRHDEQIKTLIGTMEGGMSRLEIALTQHVQEDREMAKEVSSLKMHGLANKRSLATITGVITLAVAMAEGLHHFLFIAPALAEVAKKAAGH